MKLRNTAWLYLLRVIRIGALFFVVTCLSAPEKTQALGEPSPNNKIAEEKISFFVTKRNRRVYPELRQAGALRRRQLILSLPEKGCLSEAFDSLLFHGVSGDKFHLQKIPSCEQQITVLSARDLYGYQNFISQLGGWNHPAEVLPRWAEDDRWIILGFAPLDDDTIFVETENVEGEYRTFQVSEIILHSLR